VQVTIERPHFKRILITGGAGFIGCNFVRMLLEHSLAFTANEIIVLDALTYASNIEAISPFISNEQITFIEGNITNSQLVEELTKGVDLIVNFAAESHVDRSIVDSSSFINSNVLGVDILLQAARKNSVACFIQISTDEVYGTISEGSWTEDYPLKPNSPYSASKASADLVALAHSKTHNMDIRITRCCNNYGPFQHDEKFIPTCINNLRAGMPVPIYGSGNQIREWIHVEDHCVGIGLVVAFGAKGEIYNIGSGHEETNLDVAKKIAEIMGSTGGAINHIEDRKGHDFRYSINFSKIATLGFFPKKIWETEIENLIKWFVGKSNSN
jgi:dTDP-glucose 4,6-dehydratase